MSEGGLRVTSVTLVAQAISKIRPHPVCALWVQGYGLELREALSHDWSHESSCAHRNHPPPRRPHPYPLRQGGGLHPVTHRRY